MTTVVITDEDCFSDCDGHVAHDFLQEVDSVLRAGSVIDCEEASELDVSE